MIGFVLNLFLVHGIGLLLHFGLQMQVGQDELACGRNALFVWLGLNEIAIEPQDLSDIVPIGPRGSSLYDLKVAATELGFPAEVVDFGSSGIASLPLPCVLHVQFPELEYGGHFVVLLNRVGDDVFIVDPNMPKVISVSEESLASIATGYALVSVDQLRTQRSPRNYCIAATLLLTAFLLIRACFGEVVSKWSLMWLFSLLLYFVFIVGCGGQDEKVNAYAKPITEATLQQLTALSWQRDSKDFGLVDKSEVVAEFFLKNETSETVEIMLSDVSCVCLSASLSNNSVLPGESAVLSLTLWDGGMPGERRGSVGVSVNGLQGSNRFLARAIFEGVGGNSLVFRIEDGVPVASELLVGRIFTGPNVKTEDISLDNVEWFEGTNPKIDFSNFTVNEVSKESTFCEFQYKILVTPSSYCEQGAYQYRMNLLVSNQIRSFAGRLMILRRIHGTGSDKN